MIPNRCARISSKKIVAVGERLRTFLHSPVGLRWLFHDVPEAAGWAAGGCGYLALALKRWGGRNVKLRILNSTSTLFPLVVDHVVAEVGGYVLDGSGATPKSEFLKAWARHSRRDARFRWGPIKGQGTRIYSDVCRWVPGAVPRLAAKLEEKLGGPDVALCLGRGERGRPPHSWVLAS